MGKKQDWYARSPADYLVDTVGLTMLEHGAYTLLLDRYYHDGFLPSDVQRLFNMCSTCVQQDKEAMQRVIDRYFIVDGEFLKQKRVEEELEKTRALVGKKSTAGKASAASRGLKKKNNPTGVEQKATHNNTPQDITRHSAGPSGPRSAGAEHPAPSLPNALENPPTVNSITSDPVKAESSKALKKTAREILGYLNRATNKKFQDVESNLEPIVARLKEGASPQQIKSVIVERVQHWGPDEKMHEFLRPDTLFRRSKFWNYLGNITALDKESLRGIESMPDVLGEPGADDGK